MYPHEIGQQLRQAEGLIYIPLAQAQPSLDKINQLRLWIGENALRFRCDSDGETLLIDRHDFFEAPLGEYGELKRRDLGVTDLFRRLVNGFLEFCHEIRQLDSQKRIGVFLGFSSGDLVICNWGDELRLWDKVPAELFTSERVTVLSSSEIGPPPT